MSPRTKRFAAAVVLLIAFAALAVIASHRPADGFDQTIDAHVHRWIMAHPLWIRIAGLAGLITQPMVIRVLAIVAAAALALTHHARHSIWLLAVILATGVIGIALKTLFARARPSWTDPISTLGDYSFPSSHALHAAAAAGAVIVLANTLAPPQNPRARRWIIAGRVMVLALAAVIGADRVALGVHYPTDVLAGWALGTAVVLVVPRPWNAPT